MFEASVSVDAIRGWLSRTDPGEAAQILIGCQLDDGKSDELVDIQNVDVAAEILIVSEGRRVRLRTVTGGMVIDSRPGHPLVTAIDSAKTPGERREAEMDAELRRRRMDPNGFRSSAEREQVLGFLVMVENGQLPSESALREFYEAMKPAASPAKHRRAAEALQALMATCMQHGDVPSSLSWRLAWCLNQAGQLDEAVATTETPHARAGQGMDRAVLAIIRASALIALADIRHDPGLLDQAEAALKVAYAIEGGGSEEVKAVYGALNRARHGNDDGDRGHRGSRRR